MIEQIPLPIRAQEEATFANFYAGDNQGALDALNKGLKGEGESFIYLWGNSGVGRTHLLQACCHAMPVVSADIVYLPLKHPNLSPLMLNDLENKRLVCLDDIDAVMGQPLWEEALLHFYNRALEKGTRVVMVGNDMPPRLGCQLADLRSRLSWGWVFHIAALSDAQKIEALQMRAHQRGFELPEEVGHFLIHHYPRDMQALLQLLDRLDHASLSAQRKITIPFLKEVIENG